MTIDRRDLLRREVAVDGPRRRGRSRGRTALIPRLMIATLAVSAAIGQPATAQSVAVPAFTLPPSSQLSPGLLVC